MRKSFPAAFIVSFGLAACSALPDGPGTFAGSPAVVAQAAVPPAASVESDAPGGATSAPAYVPDGRNRRASDFVKMYPHLFSKKEDLKPWPKKGTKEWDEQQAKDKHEQKRLDEVTKICRDC